MNDIPIELLAAGAVNVLFYAVRILVPEWFANKAAVTKLKRIAISLVVSGAIVWGTMNPQWTIEGIRHFLYTWLLAYGIAQGAHTLTSTGAKVIRRES